MAGETRHKILDAAEKLILLKGLGRITTKELARETGLSEGALYRHFDHKEDIFFAILHKHLPTLLEAFQKRQAGTGTISENLVMIMEAVMHYYEQLVPMSAAFLADTELLVRFREVVQSINAGPQILIFTVAAYIEEEQRLGRLGSHIPAVNIAQLLVGPCFQHVYIGQIMGYDPFGLTNEQFARELVEGLMSGIQPV